MNRCHYCNQKGHNRRTCPAAKAAAANGDPHAKYIQSRNEAAKTNMAAKRIYLSRACSYCKGSGHNLQTCPKKSTDHRELIEKSKSVRLHFLNFCKREGLGIGTLIQRTKWDNGKIVPAHQQGGIGMISGINPLHIHARCAHTWCIQANFAGEKKNISIPTKFFFEEDIDKIWTPWSENMWEIVSPAGNFPNLDYAWLNGCDLKAEDIARIG